MANNELDAIFEGMFEAIICHSIGRVTFKKDLAQIKTEAYEYYQSIAAIKAAKCSIPESAR